MNDCHARQLRAKTMQSYEQALKLFAVWLNDTVEITVIGKTQLIIFVNISLTTLRNKSAKLYLLADTDIYSFILIRGNSYIKVPEEAYLDITDSDFKNSTADSSN